MVMIILKENLFLGGGDLFIFFVCLFFGEIPVFIGIEYYETTTDNVIEIQAYYLFFYFTVPDHSLSKYPRG